MNFPLLTVITSVFAALIIAPLTAVVARYMGVVDRPDGHRKLHSKAVPLTGGPTVLLSIICAVMATNYAFPNLLQSTEGDLRFLLSLAAASFLIVLVGLIDDRFGLRGRQKLAGQFLAAVVMVLAHLALQHTRFGRFVYMTGGNREAARLAGVRTDRVIVSALAISGVTAATGGLVNAGRLNSVSLDQNADLLLDAVACVVLGGTSLFGGEGSMGRTLIGVLTFTTLKVGLNLTNVERLIKNSPLSENLKTDWLQASWVTQFDLLRPFLLGSVLLIALVIHGRLAKRRA